MQDVNKKIKILNFSHKSKTYTHNKLTQTKINEKKSILKYTTISVFALKLTSFFFFFFSVFAPNYFQEIKGINTNVVTILKKTLRAT